MNWASTLRAEPTYNSLAGCAKQTVLWEQGVKPTKYQSLPEVTGSWSSLLGNVNSLLFLNQTFDTNSDFMPEGREKIIHSHGSVAAIRWTNAANSPFSGLFAPGDVCGVARLSLAGSPDTLGFTPGLAVKLLVDGRPSVNFQVMEQLDGQGDDHNVFARTFTNHLPAPTGFATRSLDFALSLIGRDLRHLDVDQGAYITSNGQAALSVAAPDQLAFVPSQSQAIAADTQNDFRDELAQFAPGTKIYDVYGLTGNQWIRFATVTLKTSFTASSFGDQQLFFRHKQ